MPLRTEAFESLIEARVAALARAAELLNAVADQIREVVKIIARLADEA
jgi:hypothetical protein